MSVVKRMRLNEVVRRGIGYYEVLSSVLDFSAQSVLDVGVGYGETISFLFRGRKKPLSVGLDIFVPWLVHCKNKRVHFDYVRCDARNLPIRRKTFDTVLALELLEHLPKDDGRKVVRDFETIARKQIVLSAPTGFQPQESEKQGLRNPFQKHLSGWTPMELKKLGFKVCGANGARFLKSGWFCPIPRLSALSPVTILLVFLCAPILRAIPQFAFQMICSKRLDP